MKQFLKQFLIISSSIAIVIFLLVAPSCGPSKEEIEYRAAHPEPGKNPNIKYVSIKISDCECGNVTLQYYEANGHDYIGRLNNTSSDHMTHAGECKRCLKVQDSLIKKNLKDFFALKK